MAKGGASVMVDRWIDAETGYAWTMRRTVRQNLLCDDVRVRADYP